MPVEGNRISVRENEWLSKWAKEQVCSPETLSRCEKEEKAVAADSFELFYVKKKTVSSSSSVCSDLTFTFKPCGLWKSSPSNIDPAVVCTETEDGGETVWNTYTEKSFKETFWVSKATFQFILSHIRHDFERNTVTEDPISPEKRLGVYLYRLARGDYHYTIAEMAEIGVATVSTVVDEVCEAIVKNMWAISVDRHFPEGEVFIKSQCM